MMRPEVIEARQLYPTLKPEQRAFLEALPHHYSIGAAAKAVGIGRRTVYEWVHRESCDTGESCRSSECFTHLFAQAKEQALDEVESRMFERAINGDMAWDATRGIFLLKSLRREQYGERLDIRQQSVSINLTGDIASLTDSDRVSLLQLAADEQRRLLELPEPSHPDDQV